MTSTAHDLGVSVGAWNAVVRRARIGRERKAGCLIVSSYARADGTKIHCGVSRLAVDMEVSYSTARRHLAWMRQVGLIQLVRAGNRRRNHSDEYRLILGPNVLEEVEVLDPATYKALSEDIRSTNTERQRGARARVVDNSDQRSVMVSADPASPDTDQRSSRVSAKASDQRSNEARSALTHDEPPSTKTISQGRSFSQDADDEELRTDLAVGAEPETPKPTPKCDHGLRAAARADGRPACALCRVQQDRDSGVQRFAPTRPAVLPPPGWVAPVIDLNDRRETS